MKITYIFYSILLFIFVGQNLCAQMVVIEGRRYQLGRIYYLNDQGLQGSGFFHYDESGSLKFIRHGYCIEKDEETGDYSKAKYVNGIMEGEGEVKSGNYKYVGQFENGEYHGLGTLTNLKTGRRQHGYFENGRFVRQVMREGPYVNEEMFAEDSKIGRFDLNSEIYEAWSRIP
jgi:hypothetical protein